MISNQIINNCINDVNNISKVEFSVYDGLGNMICNTSEIKEIDRTTVINFMQSEAESEDINGCMLFKIYDEDVIAYVLVAKGADETFLVGKLCAGQLSNLVVAYKDRVDRNSFIQNLLLDNMLLVDIYNKAQKLHIDAVLPRCVFVIELSRKNDNTLLEMVKALFSTEAGDFVTTVDEDHIIVIKALSSDSDDLYSKQDSPENVAKMLVDMFNSELMTNVRVSYGNIVKEIKGVSKSYKEAIMALDVAKIFYSEKKIISYATLGIGRLIYQLPINLCRMYLQEVFEGDIPTDIDDEILSTVNKFLENNLNISETSRQLYIHRNTLVYRIEKLEKATGLDVRLFDDALNFRIATMVQRYINYIDSKQ